MLPEGYVIDYELLTFVLGLITAILTFSSLRASKHSNNLQAKLDRIKDYAKRCQVIEYSYLDIVMLGPRYSGKSSVTRLWTQPWGDITTTRPSQEWECRETSIFELASVKYFDELFDIHRIKKTELRLRIHDYPGEDRYRLEALEKIPTLQKPVLLLFLEIEANSNGLYASNKNNIYYSRAFMDTLERSSGLTGKLHKIIMVFNKRDLLPTEWPEEKIKRELFKINQDAVRRIESLFSGKLEVFFVSAQENTRLISLLGSASFSVLGEDVSRKLEIEMQHIQEKRAR